MVNHGVFAYISNPAWAITPEWVFGLWRRFMCRRGHHLFDEVLTDTEDHYLSCDACELEVWIAHIVQPPLRVRWGADWPEANVHGCHHQGCTSTDTTPCGVSDPKGGDDLVWFYCPEHAKENGFCWGCGGFYAGTNEYERGWPGILCSNCQEPECEEEEYYD